LANNWLFYKASFEKLKLGLAFNQSSSAMKAAYSNHFGTKGNKIHYPNDNIIQIQYILNLLLKFSLGLDQSDEKTQMKTFLLVKTFKLISN